MLKFGCVSGIVEHDEEEDDDDDDDDEDEVEDAGELTPFEAAADVSGNKGFVEDFFFFNKSGTLMS